MLMARPHVTIITPSFNQRAFIERCVASVIGQSYSDWEQIVVDDGSQDGTAEYVASCTDPRVQVIQMRHRGLAALAETYNTALGAARGDLIAVLEGDDFWPRDKLQIQVPDFQDADLLLSWGKGVLVDAQDRRVGLMEKMRCDTARIVLDRRDVFRRLVRRNVIAPAVTVVLRKTALDRIGGFRQDGSKLFVDLPTWLRVLSSMNGKVAYHSAILGFWRKHSGQTTAQYGYLMDLEECSVVSRFAETWDPQQLSSVGWNADMARHNVAKAASVRGAELLRRGQFATARAEFMQSLSSARDSEDRAKACIGLISSLLHYDVLSRARSGRSRVAKWRGH
jgi:glycosyltransferase involved in cell wall biosynthesis